MNSNPNNAANEFDTNDVSNNTTGELQDEVAAAIEELKAAQAKLDAAQAKLNEKSEEEQKKQPTEGVEVLSPIEPAVLTQAVASKESEIPVEQVTPLQSVQATEFAQPPASVEAAQATESARSVEQPQTTYSTYAYVPPASSGTAPGVSTPHPDPYAQQPYYTTYNTVPPQTPQPQQQYYYQQPYTQPVVATKDHIAAGLLALFLGCLGIHKFYLGYNTAGFIMLAVAILGGIFTLGIAAGVIGMIGVIEGIIYLVKSQSEFEQLYVFKKREWF